MKNKRFFKNLFQISSAILVGFLVNLANFHFIRTYGLPDIQYGPLVYGAVCEEILKLGTFYLLYKLKIHPYKAGMFGIGYGFFEQLFKFAFGRNISIVTMWMHIMAGVVMAYMFEKGVRTKSKRYKIYSFVFPLLIHLTFNGLIMLYLWLYF